MAQPKTRYWFKARYSIGEALEELTDDEAGLICKAIWKFAENNKEPEDIPQKLKPLWKVFRADLIQDDIDRANGAKGGNPALIHPHLVQGGLNPGSTGYSSGLSKEEKRIEEKEEEKDTDIDAAAPGGGKNSSKRFIIPSVDEVRAYCEERKNGIDPEHFVDYYERSGWIMNNGQRMKNWKAAVRTWESNRKEGIKNGRGSQNNRSTDEKVRSDYSFLRNRSETI